MMKMMSVKKTRRPYGYTKLDKEDPEEIRHRRAQFLIYKALEKADHGCRRRPCLVRIKMRKLKIKINKGFTIINNKILSRLSAATLGMKRFMFGPSQKPEDHAS